MLGDSHGDGAVALLHVLQQAERRAEESLSPPTVHARLLKESGKMGGCDSRMAVTPSVAVSQGPFEFCDLAWQGSKRIELGDELGWVKAKEMWCLDILPAANEKGGSGDQAYEWVCKGKFGIASL